MKRAYSVSTLILAITGTLVLVLVTVFAFSAIGSYNRENRTYSILSSVRVSRDIVLVREALRIELGLIDTTIAEPAAATDTTLKKLALLHGRSNEALQRVEFDIAHFSNSEIPAPLLGRLRKEVAALNGTLYPSIILAAKSPRSERPKSLIYDPKTSSNAILGIIDNQAASLSRHIASAGPFLAELMRISDIAWHVRVDAGEDRRTLAGLIAERRAPSVMQLEHLAKTSGRLEAPWQSIERSVQEMSYPPTLVRAIDAANLNYFRQHNNLRNHIIEASRRGHPLDISGPEWLKETNPALNSLMQVSKAALDVAEERAREDIEKSKHDFRLAVLLMALSIGLASFVTGFVLWRVIRPLKLLTKAIASEDEKVIDRVIALCGRGDEIGHLAQALHTFRKAAHERLLMEGELAKQRSAKDAAETSSRMKSEFLANMSHELRTPLNAVIGFSELMLHKTFGPLSAKYEEYAKTINDAGNHLLSLVSDILDLAKIEAGRFQPDFRPVSLPECIESCATLLERKMGERDIRVKLAIYDAGLLIEADDRACRQVIINLLSNAVKFSPQGGSIMVSFEVERDNAVLTVRDEGDGIPADVLARLGQPF